MNPLFRHRVCAFLLISPLLAIAGVHQAAAQSPAVPRFPSTAVAAATPPAKPSPGDLRRSREEYDQGVRAERAGDWDAAFAAFSEASRLAPNDRGFELRREFARSELVQEQTQRAEKELLGGRNDLARASLQVALRLDPGYTVASERLQQIAAMTPRDTAEPERIAGPLQLKPRPGIHDFDYRGTTRGAYEEVARQFGLVASFDGDLTDRQLRFRGDQLDFEDAMRVLGEQTNTFWRPVDTGTFFVAADTTAKHRDYDLEVKKTIQLPESETNDEMTETSRVVRDIVGLRRTDLDLNSRTLTIRDTAQNVALADALVKELQAPHGEFLLDIDLLEVDRSSSLNLGITPPSTASTFSLSSSEIQTLKQAANAGTLLEAIQNIFGSQNPLAGSSGVASAIPPLIAFGGGKTIFLATLSGATATFSQTLSTLQSAQRVLLRVQDGRPATFFVGEHYPITLALLSGSLAASSAQFTPSSSAASFPRTDYNVGNTPTGVAIGTFNTLNNSSLDLAVTNNGVTPSTVSILLGNGDGTFEEEAPDIPVGNGARAIVAGEFDSTNNTNTDLAVVNQTDGTVSILLGNASGGFSKPNPDIAVGKGPVAIVTGEFNTTNNANLDLAVVNQTDGTVSILLGNGDGTFQTQQVFAVGASPTAIATGDFNNDGIPDLAVTNSGPSPGTVSILIGKGDGTFTKLSPDIAVGNMPSAIVTGTFDTSNATNNNVGLAVANNSDDTITILLGNGNDSFSSPTPAALSTGTGPSALLSADFNNDGVPDLVVANEGAATVSVFLGLGNGTFSAPLSLATGNSPVALADGDVNGDGFPDLAVVNQASNSVSLILNSISAISGLTTPNAGLTPYPGSEYVDLGLKVHAVPRMHPDGDISLDLQFDISALAGTNVNGIPILSNRSIQQSVRLHPGESSILSGLIESNDLRTITGYPSLAEAGPLGYLTGLHDKQTSDTELLIAVTPRQLRLTERPDRTFYAGRGEGEAAPPPAAAPTVAPGAPPGAPPPGAPPSGEPGTTLPGNLPPGAPGRGGPVPGGPAPGTQPPTGNQPGPGAAPEPAPPPPAGPGAPGPG